VDIAWFDGKVDCFSFPRSDIRPQSCYKTQTIIMSGVELELPMQCAQPPIGICVHVEMHEKIRSEPFDHF